MGAHRPRRRKEGPQSEGQRWLTLAEARSVLGLQTDEIVQYWVDLGLLRSRAGDDGGMQVLDADVRHEKQVREELSAIGGDEMTPEELEALEASRPGSLPWKRGTSQPAA